MRGRVGLAVVLVAALVFTPQVAPAGCPEMGATDITCNSSSSSIEGCANALWTELTTVTSFSESLQKYPRYPIGRMSMIRQARVDMPAAIRLLGGARNYQLNDRDVPCYAAWNAVERCEIALHSAHRGLQLLTNPKVLAALSTSTRDRLAQRMRQHEAQDRAQLDLIAASGQGDPSKLCNDTYASETACSGAVAADQAALRRQVFPVYLCGEIWPGKFVTAKDAAAEARRGADHPNPGVLRNEMTFDQAREFYRVRLREESKRLKRLMSAR